MADPDLGLLAGYAEQDTERFVGEPDKRPLRDPFARDRARVLHSAALRRLAAKTQVLVAGQSDIPRTRLTHTLEVAQVAREIAAYLGSSPDLVEMAGLAHDLGHPPFGHNGEDALNEVSTAAGGFEGNAQSFRVLTRLEAKVATGGTSAGLNLTRAGLDAVTKYPWPRRESTRKFGVYADDLAVFDWMRRPAPTEQGRPRRAIEAQIMDWADDVAYSVHDFEDAVLLSHLDPKLFGSATERSEIVVQAQVSYDPKADANQLAEALDRLLAVEPWPTTFDGSHRALAGLKTLTSTLIGRFSNAAQQATRERYGDGALTRYHANLVVPADARAEVMIMKAVAVRYVMQRPGAERTYMRQRELLQELVAALVLRGGRGLDPWLADEWDNADDDAARLRVTIDQVASLTDVSAVEWHRRVCS